MYLRSDTTVEYFSFLQFSRLQKMLDIFKLMVRDCFVKSKFFLRSPKGHTDLWHFSILGWSMTS